MLKEGCDRGRTDTLHEEPPVFIPPTDVDDSGAAEMVGFIAVLMIDDALSIVGGEKWPRCRLELAQRWRKVTVAEC